MNYKRDRITIGDAKNKNRYLFNNQLCECCGKQRGDIHHHIRKQFRYKGEVYEIELPINYSTLCLQCHGIIEYNENQYYRELFKVVTCKPFSYWHELKDGIDVEELIESYINE